MNFLNKLKQRGLLQDYTNEESLAALPAGTSFYVGFDPTASSLQLGNLVPLLTAAQLAKSGLRPYILFGGATGLVGDPSGKSMERPLLDPESIRKNVALQSDQVSQIFSRLNLKCEFVNNLDWTKDISLISFLRDYGKYLTVNYMISKDVVKNRLQDPGISYTEFSYMLLQALDFVHLYKNHNVRLQIGGSDQWGNITAGLELIRKKLNGEAHALSIPLVTDANGKKFGKSENGAIWLNAEMTAPYQLYQYLLNVDDRDIIKLLKCLTLLEDSEITNAEIELTKDPSKRFAQKLLAEKVIEVVHGIEAYNEVKKAASALFSGEICELSRASLLQVIGEVPSITIKISELLNLPVLDLLVKAGTAKSKGEARRLISNKGAYINNQVILDPDLQITNKHILDSGVILIRSGKKSYFLVDVEK